MAEGYDSEVFNPQEDCCFVCQAGFTDDDQSVTSSRKGILTLISYNEKIESL